MGRGFKGMNRQHIVFNPATGLFTVKGKCVYCEEPQSFVIPDSDAKGFHNWCNGQDINIQDALPNVSAENRELLLSGICSKCWDSMFK